MTAREELQNSLAGRYVIEREIGRGGMATVFLASDLRHDRKVALKVLHPDLAAALGAERFLTEIRTTANLQHPHILPLHDSGSEGGFLYYVMPFVAGETLRARLEREQQLPIGDAVRIAREVASAIDYAHRHGVIHRDIKPENVLLHDGSALVADFGIALAVQSAGGARMTQTGLSLGTPQYMSPEQAMGERTIDARSDVYALGAITYEMLTGEPPFTGASVQAIVAKVMTERPTAPSTVRDTVPDAVERAVLTALAKLPADRFATAAQFSEALGDSTGGRTAAVARRVGAASSRSSRAVLTGLVLLSLLLGAVAAVGWWKAAHPPAAGTIRFALALPGKQVLADAPGVSVAMSPDGRTIAYIAREAQMRSIHLRRLDELSARLLAGTNGASDLRFSPDGKWIAFFLGDEPRSKGEIVKIAIDGGAVVPVARTGRFNGMSWAGGDSIVYADGGGLSVVSASGGTYRRRIDPTDGGRQTMNPFVFPDGETVAYWTSASSGRRLSLVKLSGGSPVVTDVDAVALIAYVENWLVFARQDGSVAAKRLDLSTGRTSGEMKQLFTGLRVTSASASASMSTQGDAAFILGAGGASLRVVDESGRITYTAPERLSYAYPAWSPDGHRIAVQISGRAGSDGAPQIFVLDTRSGALSRLTRGGGIRPAWTPDGTRIAFVRDVPAGLYWTPADGSGPEEQLVAGRYREIAFTPDGRQFVTRTDSSSTVQPLELISVAGDRTSTVLLRGPFVAAMPSVAPDSRWVTYHSDESGTLEVYARPLQGTGGRVQISSGGGAEPRWSHDGHHIVYRTRRGAFMSATIAMSGGGVSVVRQDSLFADRYAGNTATHQQYDVHPDGRHFVVIDNSTEDASLVVVTNWLAEVRRQLLP